MNKFYPLAYLSGLNIDVMRFGLQAISRLLARLANPQNSYSTILIAGTNGKGSTAAMTASILRCAGYCVGLYTSPHLTDVRERIAVNGRKISKHDFSELIAAVKNEIDLPVTYFEALTAAAFLYFQQRKVDLAVLEVGLGGRLDATNVCRPLVSVITNIGFDHMSYLGKSLTAIAKEKAGIIKSSSVCLTAVKQKNVLKMLKDICQSRRSRLYCLGREIKIIQQKNGLFKYQGLSGDLDNLTAALPGRHQLDNAALALAITEVIGKHGFSVDNAAKKQGLKRVRWAARLEILHHQPLFILDGAHNPAGIAALCRALKNEFSYRRLILIFSVLADKDYRLMIRKIAPLAQRIILTPLQSKRSLAVAKLHEQVKKMGRTALIAGSVTEAMRDAFRLAREQDAICVAGSLYLAGEVKRSLPQLGFSDEKV